MSNKIIILKDNNTGEDIFPTIPSNYVLNRLGENIVGILDREFFDYYNTSNNWGTNKIASMLQKIKSLENIESSSLQRKLSSIVVDNIFNKNRLNYIKDINDNLENKLQNYENDFVNKELGDLCNSQEIINMVENTIESKPFIVYGTPEFAPVGKELMIDENNIYIGIDGVWYVINKNGIV